VTLKVDDLRISYRTLHGDVRAVDGVSFSIADGEIMGLAGESGCGKSTLGNSLIFLEGRMKHVGGTVELDGVNLPIADYKAMNRHRLRDVSVVPQYAMSALNPTRKIGRMTADLIKSRGTDFRKVLEEFKRRIDLVGLPQNVLNMYPFELSGGMRRRVGIARAVVSEPPLVLYDSPTAGLDPITANTIMALIAKERDSRNTANLIVTQRYQDGQLMANFRYNRNSGHLEPASTNGAGGGLGSNPTRTIFMVMKDGRVVFEGTQHELEACQDDYVQKFVPKHS